MKVPRDPHCMHAPLVTCGSLGTNSVKATVECPRARGDCRGCQHCAKGQCEGSQGIFQGQNRGGAAPKVLQRRVCRALYKSHDCYHSRASLGPKSLLPLSKLDRVGPIDNSSSTD